MRTEISQAKKENQFYLSSVERSKALKQIEDRKRKRGEEMDLSGIKRKYRQRKTISGGDDSAGPSSRLSDELLLKVCCLLLLLRLLLCIIRMFWMGYRHQCRYWYKIKYVCVTMCSIMMSPF